MKFSLRTLLVVALAISIACALLTSRSEFAAWLTSTIFSLSLIGSLIAVIYTSGAVRAFWIGYAIAGWGQKWLSFSTSSHYGFLVHDLFYGGIPFPDAVGNRINQNYVDTAARFINTLDSLESIAIALAAGYLAAFLFLRREKGMTR